MPQCNDEYCKRKVKKCGLRGCSSGRVNFAVEYAGVGGDGEEVLELRRLDQFADEEGGVLLGFVAMWRDGVFGAGEFGVDVLVAE